MRRRRVVVVRAEDKFNIERFAQEVFQRALADDPPAVDDRDPVADRFRPR